MPTLHTTCNAVISETLLRYILRPPLAQDHVVAGPNGLVRIVLKRAFSDGTITVDMTRFVIPEGGDPLSLLCREKRSLDVRTPSI